MILRTSEELSPAVGKVLKQISALLAHLLPEAESYHIGSTAIPGALTKGDLDVLLRVESTQFESAVDVLRKHFDVKQSENWEPCFASFGNDTDYVLPLGIQLAVKESDADVFLFIHDYLVGHPEVLEAYNRVKQEYADRSSDEYWAAKDRILGPIVALRKAPANRVAGGS